MIAVDTSSLVEYLRGSQGFDIECVDQALMDNNLILPPIVLTEILSDPKLSQSIKKHLQEIPSLELKEEFWIRSGELRAKALRKKRKARLGDALIAQFCIDHKLQLITRDEDFKIFAEVANLKLLGPHIKS